MTKHVCAVCGYSLDDREHDGPLSAALSLHMRLKHCPQPVYHYDADADEYVYKLLLPTETDIPQEGKEEG